LAKERCKLQRCLILAEETHHGFSLLPARCLFFLYLPGLRDFDGNYLGGWQPPPYEWPIHACTLCTRVDVMSVCHNRRS